VISWERAVAAAAVIAAAVLAARLADRAISRRALTPEVATRYRVLRRTAVTLIVIVGVLFALLTVPAVRTMATGILASTAVVALVVGLAAQRTLSNVVAGILIALAQPLRIGDRVAVAGYEGVVEEIELSYTFIRMEDGSRLVIPNEKLASDTIVNSTIVSREKVAEISLKLPLTTELGPVLAALLEETAGRPGAEAFVESLHDGALVTLRVPAASEDDAEGLERELRLRAHERLRSDGLLAAA
jgi:small-conductance mechanosensitive channel